MTISLSTYVLTVLLFSGLLFLILFLVKKNIGTETNLMELEKEIEEEERLESIKDQITIKTKELNEVKEALEKYKRFDDVLNKKIDIIEKLFNQTEENIEKAKEERKRINKKAALSSDNKKREIMQMLGDGLTIDEIAKKTKETPGFIQVVINMEQN